jgi:hypothetical protein
MRRLGVIVALSALLGMFAGVLTAAPALAGRGHKWQLLPAGPLTVPANRCGFKVRVTPVAKKTYGKLLKAADGSMTTVITGTFKVAYTKLSTGKTATENLSGPGSKPSTPTARSPRWAGAKPGTSSRPPTRSGSACPR